jgi:riboflavin kinase
MLLKGRVVNGAKEGAFFISKYRDKIREKAGFEPFPGTLNVECNSTPIWPTKSMFIPSWTEEGREFGAVWMYRCKFKNAPAAIVVPDLTRHAANVIEIISPHCLKTKYSLKTGDFVDVEVLPTA